MEQYIYGKNPYDGWTTRQWYRLTRSIPNKDDHAAVLETIILLPSDERLESLAELPHVILQAEQSLETKLPEGGEAAFSGFAVLSQQVDLPTVFSSERALSRLIQSFYLSPCSVNLEKRFGRCSRWR